MIIVMGSVRIPVENFDRALPMIGKVVSATRGEDGCLLYAYARDLLDPEVMRISEKWRDRAALTAHFQTPHMAVWAAERAELGMFDRDLRVFDTDEGEVV